MISELFLLFSIFRSCFLGFYSRLLISNKIILLKSERGADGAESPAFRFMGRQRRIRPGSTGPANAVCVLMAARVLALARKAAGYVQNFQ